MENTKEQLITLLNKAISETTAYSTEIQGKLFDISSLEQITKTESYQTCNFIKEIDDVLLNKLLSELEQTRENNKFKGNIIIIKKLIDIPDFTDKENKIMEDYHNDITKLKVLIEKVITKTNGEIALMKQTNEAKKNKYQKLLTKLNEEEAFDPKDFDEVEDLVKRYSEVDPDRILENIMTYLAKYNINCLRKDKEVPKAPQIQIVEPVVAPEPQEEKDTSKEESKEEFDLFAHQSFVREASKKEPKKKDISLRDADKTQKIKEILSYLQMNYDELDEFCQTELNKIDSLEQTETFAHYLKEQTKFFEYVKTTNSRIIVTVLVRGSKESYNNTIADLESIYNNDVRKIGRIINRNAMILTEKGSNNYFLNKEILQKYSIDLKSTFDENPLFFTRDNDKILACINRIAEKEINVHILLTKCLSAVTFGGENIEKNIRILEEYGFNIKELDSYSILTTNDVATKLDCFIELGLNEYIHKNNSRAGTSFQSLVIKKIFYAVKNNIDIWATPNTTQSKLSGIIVNNPPLDTLPRESMEKEIDAEMPASYSDNEAYNRVIESASSEITEEEISALINEHPILSIIEEGHRPQLFTDNDLNNIRRKTELTFGNKKISRLKTYRVFRALVLKNITDEDALLYAITYGSIIEPHEYDAILQSIYPVKVGEKSL